MWRGRLHPRRRSTARPFGCAQDALGYARKLAGFGGEAGGAGFAVGEGVADAAEADGSAKAAVLAVPESFLAGALELTESGGRKGSVAAAEARRVALEALGEFVDPGVADAEETGDAEGGPSRRRRKPPLPDELLDDLGFETAAPRKRRTPARGASFLNVDQARLPGARRFVAGSFAAHGAILRGRIQAARKPERQ